MGGQQGSSRALSSSAIAKFLECPQKYKFSYVDEIKVPPSWQMHLGSFVHEVLEHLYKQPVDQRNHETLKELAAKMWTENNWPAKIDALPEKVGSLGDFKRSAFEAMTNLWALLAQLEFQQVMAMATSIWMLT